MTIFRKVLKAFGYNIRSWVPCLIRTDLYTLEANYLVHYKSMHTHILDQERLDLVVSEGHDRGEGGHDGGVGGFKVFVNIVRPVLLTLALEGGVSHNSTI